MWSNRFHVRRLYSVIVLETLASLFLLVYYGPGRHPQLVKPPYIIETISSAISRLVCVREGKELLSPYELPNGFQASQTLPFSSLVLTEA